MIDIPTDALLFDLYYGGKSASEVLADGDEIQEESQIPAVTEKLRHSGISPFRESIAGEHAALCILTVFQK